MAFVKIREPLRTLNIISTLAEMSSKLTGTERKAQCTKHSDWGDTWGTVRESQTGNAERRQIFPV